MPESLEQFEIIPKVGEVLFYVCLTDVQNMTGEQALKLLIEEGYQPQLKYRQWPDGNIGIYALLSQESYDSEVQGEEYRHDEFHHLCTLFYPTTAIHLAAADVHQPKAA